MALGSLVAGLVLCGLALTVDLPRAAYALKGDESTYYCMTYSLAIDGDLTYRRQDLVRVWKEFSAGPEGIFLKRGKLADWNLTGRFPFIERQTIEDPQADRLYYAKSFIYPLCAAPFVRVFGTNGFLLFHALLLTACVASGAAFLAARGSPGLATGFSLVFLFCSSVPVYLIWISPEVFNYGVVFLAYFLWLYKEAAGGGEGQGGRWSRFLRSRWSDYAAAILLGLVTFSKPLYVPLIAPVIGMAILGRRSKHALALILVFAAIVGGLFAVNAGITGEFNFQGGDRNTFYGRTGFPYLTPEMGWKSAGQTHSTNEVPLDILVSRDALLTVFPHNVAYFVLGRHSGLLPYYPPALVSAVLFLLAWRRWERWQVLAAGTLVLSVAGLLLYMPYTYSGGGGSLGNRYAIAFYPLFLFLTPALRSAAAPLAGIVVGALFTAQLLVNPFVSSFNPTELPTRWPFRLLPAEFTLIDDMPASVNPSRVKQPLGGEPPLLGYFLDSNAFISPDGSFWVRGESTTELVVRAPARQTQDGTWETMRVKRLRIELQMGDVANEVEVRAGSARRRVKAAPHEIAVFTLEPGPGFPYRRIPGLPANRLYHVTLTSGSGFVPMFHSGGTDYRYLGVHARVVPIYE